jgi:hypothetical protein
LFGGGGDGSAGGQGLEEAVHLGVASDGDAEVGAGSGTWEVTVVHLLVPEALEKELGILSDGDLRKNEVGLAGEDAETEPG